MRLAAGIGLRLLAVAAAIGLFLLLPHLVSDFHSSDLAEAGTFFIAIVGLNILTGYTGQISLGHGALMAIGAYTTAIIVVDAGWRDVWTIPLAGLAAGIAGFIVGIPALRLSGLYLALATFAFAVAMPSVLKKEWGTGWFDHPGGLTGGSQGLSLLELAPQHVTGFNSSFSVTIFGHSMTQHHFLYYLTWSIGLVGVALAWLLLRGRLGRTFRAIRDSETAAVSAGVNLAAYKTLAFALSGVYAGVAGSLLAIQRDIVNPLSFTVLLSILIVVGAVVGGLGSLAGLVAGAFFIEYLPDIAGHVSQREGVPELVYGAAIILVMILLPGGLGGLLRRLGRPLTTWLSARP
jgi:branched-chain amino acid transport system permease protein